jgi:soluble lytic murein transglycosylase
MTTWRQAAQIDPTGYYSERAKELLAGGTPFTPSADYSLTYDEQGERAEAENWLKSTFALPEETDLSAAPLLADSRTWRGTELWRLGLYNEARAEFESLRSDLSSDAAGLFRLAVFFTDLGLYRPGIIAARQVLDLAGMDDAATLNAPIYFNRIRFGTYFGEIVIPVTQTYNFEPLFFFSIMRQESLFEGFVTSSAGARGLMQIIPTTGQEIFNRNGWPPNYTAEDLYRPLVSVRYGADYLATQRNLLDGDMYAALAAYNGGPGNALAWRELANGDPDLFVEVVRFQETRNYIRSIYEIYAIYKGLYGVEN